MPTFSLYSMSSLFTYILLIINNPHDCSRVKLCLIGYLSIFKYFVHKLVNLLCNTLIKIIIFNTLVK